MTNKKKWHFITIIQKWNHSKAHTKSKSYLLINTHKRNRNMKHQCIKHKTRIKTKYNLTAPPTSNFLGTSLKAETWVSLCKFSFCSTLNPEIESISRLICLNYKQVRQKTQRWRQNNVTSTNMNDRLTLNERLSPDFVRSDCNLPASIHSHWNLADKFEQAI